MQLGQAAIESVWTEKTLQWVAGCARVARRTGLTDKGTSFVRSPNACCCARDFDEKYQGHYQRSAGTTVIVIVPVIVSPVTSLHVDLSAHADAD